MPNFKICHTCKRNNAEDSVFCIFCGGQLLPKEIYEDPPLAHQHSAEISHHQTQFEIQVAQIRFALANLADRVTTLEVVNSGGRSKITSQIPTPRNRTQNTSERNADSPQKIRSTGIGAFIDWKRLLAGNWLALIGTISLVTGIAFFLKLAFENSWIGPTGQVSTGIIIGISLLVLGEYWARKYLFWAQALTGGGIAILYLSVYAAFSQFSLISNLMAFLFLGLITFATVILSVRYNAKLIGLFGILGGLTTPLILSEELPNQWMLLTYLLILDLGVLIISFAKNWRPFSLGALFGSFALLIIFFDRFETLNPSIFFAQLSVTATFLLFFGGTIAPIILRSHNTRNLDVTVIISNATLFFGTSYMVLEEEHRIWMGAFALSLALFYGIWGYLVLLHGILYARLSMVLTGVALIFLTLAFPLQIITQDTWITVAWAIEGLILLFLSLRLKILPLRVFSLIVFTAMVFRLIFVDSQIELTPSFQPIFNKRVLAFCIGIGATGMAARFLRLNQHLLKDKEILLFPSFVILSTSLILGILSIEMMMYFDHQIMLSKELLRTGIWASRGVEGLDNIGDLALTVSWGIFGSVIFSAGILRNWKWVRLGGLSFLAIPVLKLFLYDSFALSSGYRVAAFITLGIILLFGGFLFQKYQAEIKGFLFEESPS
jgi:uncharacterized membrane protein